MIQIKIIGPGLFVNSPVALIYKILKEYGYDVTLEEFCGQYQDSEGGDSLRHGYPENSLPKNKNNSIFEIDMKVHPEPWGG